jgi:hypothetical protein
VLEYLSSCSRLASVHALIDQNGKATTKGHLNDAERLFIEAKTGAVYASSCGMLQPSQVVPEGHLQRAGVVRHTSSTAALKTAMQFARDQKEPATDFGGVGLGFNDARLRRLKGGDLVWAINASGSWWPASICQDVEQAAFKPEHAALKKAVCLERDSGGSDLVSVVFDPVGRTHMAGKMDVYKINPTSISKDLGKTTVLAVDGTDCAYGSRYPVGGTVMLSNGVSFNNPAELIVGTSQETGPRLSYFVPRSENLDSAWQAVPVPRSVLDARRARKNVLCVHFFGTEYW